MNIFKEMQQVGEALEKVKSMQNNCLDIYSPENKPLIHLLKELVSLEKEFEELTTDLEQLLNSND